MRGWNLAAPKTEQMGYSGSIYKIEFFVHFSIGVSESNESLLWWPKNEKSGLSHRIYQARVGPFSNLAVFIGGESACRGTLPESLSGVGNEAACVDDFLTCGGKWQNGKLPA